MPRPTQNVSEILKQFVENHKDDKIPFGSLVDAFKERGFGILLMLFASIPALPLPAPPGITTLLALPIFILAIQMALGKRVPWLPKWLRKKHFKRSTLLKVSEKMGSILAFFEKFLHPRLLYMSNRFGEKMIGFVALICSISVAMPFPFTNTVPSMGVFIMSLGLLERDGLIIKAGMIVGGIGIIISLSIFFAGKEALSFLLI